MFNDEGGANGALSDQVADENQREERTMQRVCVIVKNPVFVFCVLAISGLYFVVCGLQYWISAYLQIVLSIKDTEVYWYYAFTCLTAPISGVIVGGVIFGSLGGYNSPKAFCLCVILGACASIFALPVPFIEHKFFVYMCLWFVFFFGASILPTMTGIMLNSVEVQRRTTANSLATLAYNLFGYLPSPFIYGFFSDVVKNNESLSHRVALAVILYWSIAAVLFMFIAMLCRTKKCGKQRQLKQRLIQPSQPTVDK